jgi:hypothetical protein
MELTPRLVTSNGGVMTDAGSGVVMERLTVTNQRRRYSRTGEYWRALGRAMS